MNIVIGEDSPEARAFRTAHRSLDLASLIDEAGLGSVEAHVPSIVRADGLTIPIVGARDRNAYTAHPFSISWTRKSESQASVSFAPISPDGKETKLVGRPVYDPDHKGSERVSRELSARVGFASLRCVVSIGDGESTDFALLGADPYTAEEVPLALEGGLAEASTLVGALRAAANKRYNEHQQALNTQAVV
jgi:hypothetical protein